MFDMLGNILKNLTSKPVTRMYPQVSREPFKDVRGKVGIDIDACIFCGICVRKCPADALVVNKNEKSWEIDPFKCIICGACADACPKKCLEMQGPYYKPSSSKSKDKHVQG
jgi:ech hydrogenase subunit F